MANCKCAQTMVTMLTKVNQKREQAGRIPVSIDWLQAQYRKSPDARFIQPHSRVGNVRIWTEKDANRIVRLLWNKNYRPHGAAYSLLRSA